MKRGPSLAGSGRVSPTPTAFSGISNYRSESYRTMSKGRPSEPMPDSREIARTHFNELSRYLAEYLARSPPGSRATARQKLTKLTRQQFQELSTDVYDELLRRKKNTTNNEAVPFLPVRSDFHPKRNQARQKLATLPTSRFEDLSSDVYFELVRRYPEFKEEPATGTPISPSSAYDDMPEASPTSDADLPSSPRQDLSTPTGSTFGPGPASGRRSDDRDRDRDNDYASPRPSAERMRDPYPSRRKISEESGLAKSPRFGAGVGFGARRNPSNASNASGMGGVDAGGGAGAMATSGMIIPNKSTIAEEEIEVPFARDRERGDGVPPPGQRTYDDDIDSPGASPVIGGLSGLRARLGRDVDEDMDEDERDRSAEERLPSRSGSQNDSRGNRSGDEYYEKMSFGRTSVASDRSNPLSPTTTTNTLSNSRGPGGGAAGAAEAEKVRREYELKIAQMQSKLTGLEREAEKKREVEDRAREADGKVRALEEELRNLKKRADEESNAMRVLRRELDQLRDERAKDARRARDDESEIQDLRDKLERLQDEISSRPAAPSGVDAETFDQLRNDMEGLLAELGELSTRNDELVEAREQDAAAIRDLKEQAKDWRRKYEGAKTELRSAKVTSQLYHSPAPKPISDDQLPVSPDGILLDIHITAFISSIDTLLTAGRSSQPTQVLTPMKSIVNVTTIIIDDISGYISSGNSAVDIDVLRAKQERAEATLSNLVTAARTHAQGAGMSPVSLLDAAASHLSAAITDIGKTVRVRRATRGEQMQFASSSATPSAPSNGYQPKLSPLDERKTTMSPPPMSAASTTSNSNTAKEHGRGGSSGTSAIKGFFGSLTGRGITASPSSQGRPSLDEPRPSVDERRPSVEDRMAPPSSALSMQRRAPSRGSSASNSPPPHFERPGKTLGGAASDDSAPADGEDPWVELKPYLEAQAESIVIAIQSVLSGVRSATPSPSLNENITQIITIVSSIVAVCNDNLPTHAITQGKQILRELGDHANRLSEAQASGVTKESRQVMAKSSYAVANAMKSLMKL